MIFVNVSSLGTVMRLLLSLAVLTFSACSNIVILYPRGATKTHR